MEHVWEDSDVCLDRRMDTTSAYLADTLLIGVETSLLELFLFFSIGNCSHVLNKFYTSFNKNIDNGKAYQSVCHSMSELSGANVSK